MAQDSRWSEIKKLAKRNFVWWTDMSKIAADDSAATKTKKIFIKILGVCSLILFSPMYLVVLVFAFIIAL